MRTPRAGLSEEEGRASCSLPSVSRRVGVAAQLRRNGREPLATG
jgi:hypothetical protein